MIVHEKSLIQEKSWFEQSSDTSKNSVRMKICRLKEIYAAWCKIYILVHYKSKNSDALKIVLEWKFDCLKEIVDVCKQSSDIVKIVLKWEFDCLKKNRWLWCIIYFRLFENKYVKLSQSQVCFRHRHRVFVIKMFRKSRLRQALTCVVRSRRIL